MHYEHQKSVRQLMVYAGQESTTLELADIAAVVREMFPLMTVSAAKNAVFEFHLEDGHADSG